MATKRRHPSMEELLSQLPQTGIDRLEGECEAAEFVATHPETWSAKLRTAPGRPKRGTETGSIGRSIRLPPDAWARIEAKAEHQHLRLHAAMRKALLDWAVAPEEPVPTPAQVAQPPIVILITTEGQGATRTTSGADLYSAVAPFTVQ